MNENEYELRVMPEAEFVGYQSVKFKAANDEAAIELAKTSKCFKKININDLFGTSILFNVSGPAMSGFIGRLREVARWDNYSVRLYDEDWLAGDR